ncbi:hypothetical protein AMIS_46020 [Actinoplanes missouriensis 431]|uniref:Uncharacterized protein n=1 Tax=Actinoplanes missouriensis (strain ATCC 14538 / DSM 43046 / CBS 188.64 / JCM 3121 / NBRC 102363 / NCIMB 12654 / NRRL B-3342 / UNCC 431) TaxID=512565 RepID=I0H9Y5_ACTM4|nr:hypothetical protein [Actinoplanes missouriensis]BAL89822.1 hypothetical protein AMIS_46020 [Actinoplanes missouriensis 431]
MTDMTAEDPGAPMLWTPVDIDKLPEPIARVNLFQPTRSRSTSRSSGN